MCNLLILLSNSDLLIICNSFDKKRVRYNNELFFSMYKELNYFLLTTSLNFLPAENTGAVLAEILILAPV